jgi:hypothetical protein
MHAPGAQQFDRRVALLAKARLAPQAAHRVGQRRTVGARMRGHRLGREAAAQRRRDTDKRQRRFHVGLHRRSACRVGMCGEGAAQRVDQGSVGAHGSDRSALP